MKAKLLGSFGYTIAASGLFFVFNLFLAKYIGAEDYGKITYYLSFVQIVSLLISFNYAALYMGNKITRGDNNTFSLFVSMETLVFFIIFFPGYFIIDSYVADNEITLLILLCAYFLTMVSVVGLEYNANKKVSQSILYSLLIPRVLLVFLFVLLIIIGVATPKGYLYIYLLSVSLVFGYFIFYLQLKFYIKKEIFSRAWKFYLLGVIGSSLSYIAQIYQKEYGSYEELASLAIALLFISGLSLTGGVLNKFALPKIHEAWKDKDIKYLNSIYKTHTYLSSMINIPIFLFLLIFIEYISKYMGDGYTSLQMIFYILSVGYIVDLLTGITGTILRATEHEYIEIYNEIFRFVVGIGLIFILSYKHFGVVYAISISMVAYNIAKFVQVYRLFKIKPFDMDSFRDLILYVGIFGILLWCVKIWIHSLMLGIVVLMIFYIVLLKALKYKIDWSIYK
jgi:O-antigen/teichoic acid export membrane protein